MTTNRLPSRPWAIRASSTLKFSSLALLQILVFLGIVAAIVFMGGGAVRDILEQDRIWGLGVTASEASVGGEVRTQRMMLHSYKLDVEWKDAQGQRHKQRKEFALLFTKIPNPPKGEIRYDPASPGECALSDAVEHSANRWITIVIGNLFGLLMLFGVFLWLRSLLRQRAHLKAIAERGLEAALLVHEYTPAPNRKMKGVLVFDLPGQGESSGTVGRTTGSTSVLALFGRPSGGGHGYVRLKRKAPPPLFGAADRSSVLALYLPESPARPLILQEGLHPFALTPTEQERVRLEFGELSGMRVKDSFDGNLVFNTERFRLDFLQDLKKEANQRAQAQAAIVSLLVPTLLLVSERLLKDEATKGFNLYGLALSLLLLLCSLALALIVLVPVATDGSLKFKADQIVSTSLVEPLPEGGFELDVESIRLEAWTIALLLRRRDRLLRASAWLLGSAIVLSLLTLLRSLI